LFGVVLVGELVRAHALSKFSILLDSFQ
jgi:hypothetical protein